MEKHWKYEVKISHDARKLTPSDEERLIEGIFGMSLKQIGDKVRELGPEEAEKFFAGKQ